MEIELTSHFKRSFRRLDSRFQKKAVTQITLLRADPFNSRLKTHKLHGDKKEEWAFSVDRSHRITFLFVKEKMILLDVGTHDELY